MNISPPHVEQAVLPTLGKFALAVRLMGGLWFLMAWLGVLGIGWTLWWNRDRVLYQGKSPAEQRVKVFKRAGLNKKWLPVTEQAMTSWPLNAAYSLDADQQTASYIEYMLAPRVRLQGDRELSEYVLQPLKKPKGPETPEKETNNKSRRGWPGVFLAVMLLYGLGTVVDRIFKRSMSARIPEVVVVGCLITMAVVCTVRFAGLSIHTGAIGLTLIGISGLLLEIPTLKKKKTHCILTQKQNRENLAGYGLLALCAAAGITAMLMAVVVVPDDWDAWAIWGAKAKFLALGTGPLEAVTEFGHADYPLLWPSVWAYTAWLSGGWEEQWVKAWPVICMMLAGVQMFGFLREKTSSFFVACIPVAVWLTIPKNMVVSSWGYAEPFLWLCMTCAYTRLLAYFSGRRIEDAGWAIAMAVGAAYTKNEGLMFLAFLAVVLGAIALCRRQWRVWIFITAGVGCYLPWWIWVRYSLHLGSHALDGLTPGRLPALFNRFWPGVELALGIWGDIRQWGCVMVLLFLVTCWMLLRSAKTALVYVGLPCVLISMLFMIEIAHEAELSWQMSTSWDRLTLQVLPLWVLGLGAGVLQVRKERGKPA